VARLLTRRGHDWTDKMKSLAVAIQNLGIRNGWFDGEIVVMDSRGLPDFNALQNSIGNRKNENIVFFMFDAPFYGGFDLRKVPLWSRRAVLKEMLEEQDDNRVRFAQSFNAEPTQVLEAARQMAMEGVMVKRRDSPYVSGRTETWLKLKCTLQQEFVICGFTNRSGTKREVGGLLIAYHHEGQWFMPAASAPGGTRKQDKRCSRSCSSWRSAIRRLIRERSHPVDGLDARRGRSGG
jgi:bifunctional non-homologous end joining protein LigD